MINILDKNIMNFTASQQPTIINKHSQLSLAIQNAIRMRHNCAYACGTNRASSLFTNCQLIQAQGISLLHKSANTVLHECKCMNVQHIQQHH